MKGVLVSILRFMNDLNNFKLLIPILDCFTRGESFNRRHFVFVPSLATLFTGPSDTWHNVVATAIVGTWIVDGTNPLDRAWLPVVHVLSVVKDTTSLGITSEGILLGALLKAGYQVLLPFGASRV